MYANILHPRKTNNRVTGPDCRRKSEVTTITDPHRKCARRDLLRHVKGQTATKIQKYYDLCKCIIVVKKQEFTPEIWLIK